jgi:hypothetical protein
MDVLMQTSSAVFRGTVVALTAAALVGVSAGPALAATWSKSDTYRDVSSGDLVDVRINNKAKAMKVTVELANEPAEIEAFNVSIDPGAWGGTEYLYYAVYDEDTGQFEGALRKFGRKGVTEVDTDHDPRWSTRVSDEWGPEQTITTLTVRLPHRKMAKNAKGHFVMPRGYSTYSAMDFLDTPRFGWSKKIRRG